MKYSWSDHFDDFEQPFPCRSELPWPSLLPVAYSFRRTKSPAFNILSLTLWLWYLVAFCWYAVVRMLAVSLNSSKASRLLHSFLLLVSSSQYCTLCVRIFISMGTMALVSDAKEKGVSPVATLSVVLQAHIMLGSLSTHPVFAPFSLFFRPVRIVRLVTSICPLVWGWATDANLWSTPEFSANFLNSLLSNWVPLFDIRTREIPNLHIMLPHMKSIIYSAVTLLIALASGHLEKYSIATITYFLWLMVRGKGSRMSIPHWEKGQGAEILVWAIACALIALLNHWQMSHLFTNFSTSAFRLS